MFCPQCGSEVESGAKFCLNCGHNLGSQESADSEQSAGSQQSTSSQQGTVSKQPSASAGVAKPGFAQRVGPTVVAWIVGPAVVLVVYAIYSSLTSGGLSATEQGYVDQCHSGLAAASLNAEISGDEGMQGVRNLDPDRFCHCVLEELQSTTTENEYAIIIGADPDTIDYSQLGASDVTNSTSRVWDAWGNCGF